MVQTGMEHILQKSAETRLTQSPDYDIIILATARWDGDYSSTSYSLAKALAVNARVFYIDNPFTILNYVRNRNSESIKKRKNALLHGKDLFIRPDQNFSNLYNVTPRAVLPINW